MVIALAGCPLGHGHKKLGEHCQVSNDCDEVHCTSGLAKLTADMKDDPSWVCTHTCLSDADCVTSEIKMFCDIHVDPKNHAENRGTCAVKK